MAEPERTRPCLLLNCLPSTSRFLSEDSPRSADAESPRRAPIPGGQRENSPLDAARLAEIEALFADELPSLLHVYLLDTPVQLHSMTAALASHDPAVVKRIAHTVKSRSRAVRATRMADLSEGMEGLAHEHGMDEKAPSLLDELRVEYLAVARSLGRVIEKHCETKRKRLAS